MTCLTDDGIFIQLKIKVKGVYFMEDGGPTASIIYLLVMILIEFVFYGFGAAVQSLSEKDILQKIEEEKDKKYIKLFGMMEKPDRYINTVQMVQILVNMMIGYFYFSHFLGSMADFMGSYQSFLGGFALVLVSGVLSCLILLFVVLTFGVLVPKKMAAKNPEKWAYALVVPIYYITTGLSPLTGLITLVARGVLCVFGIRSEMEGSDVTEEEIISMVNEGHEQGVIEASEAEMITNIIEYGEKQAKDIMTHRTNIVAIDGIEKLHDAIKFMLTERNSRYPVYEENIDHVLGILHLKDALRYQTENPFCESSVKDIEGLIREPLLIPETRNIDDLFKCMQSTKTQMAIVVDEYGQTAGLVAMEDILEEIVGNILDEYDEEEEYIEEMSETEFVVGGMTPLEELEEKLQISFEEEEFDTLNGFLIARLDRIPEADEDFDVDYRGYNFKVLSVENKMIQSVLITKGESLIEE